MYHSMLLVLRLLVHLFVTQNQFCLVLWQCPCATQCHRVVYIYLSSFWLLFYQYALTVTHCITSIHPIGFHIVELRCLHVALGYCLWGLRVRFREDSFIQFQSCSSHCICYITTLICKSTTEVMLWLFTHRCPSRSGMLSWDTDSDILLFSFFLRSSHASQRGSVSEERPLRLRLKTKMHDGCKLWPIWQQNITECQAYSPDNWCEAKMFVTEHWCAKESGVATEVQREKEWDLMIVCKVKSIAFKLCGSLVSLSLLCSWCMFCLLVFGSIFHCKGKGGHVIPCHLFNEFVPLWCCFNPSSGCGFMEWLTHPSIR